MRKPSDLGFFAPIVVSVIAGLLLLGKPPTAPKAALEFLMASSAGFLVREVTNRQTRAKLEDDFNTRLKRVMADSDNWKTQFNQATAEAAQLRADRLTQEERLASLQETADQLAIALREVTQNLENCQNNRENLEGQIAHLSHLAEAWRAELGWQTQSLELAHLAALERLQTALEETHQLDLEELTDIQTELEKQLELLPYEYEAAIAAGRAENQSLQRENQRLYQTIEDYHRPKKLGGAGKAAYNADRLVDFYLAQGIACDAVKAEARGAFDDVWLKPRGAIGLSELSRFSDVLHLEFDLVDKPEFSVSEGCVKLRMKTEAIATTDKVERKLVDPAPDWFKATVLEAKHLRFSGEGESGKSTIVNNVIGVLRSEFPELRVRLADPVWESDSNNWDFEAEWKGSEESLEALELAAKTVQDRLDGVDQSRELQVFLVDEIDILAEDFPEAVPRCIKKVWKQGRHVGIWLGIIGQSSRVKTIKLLRTDIRNAANFYLGANIPDGIKDLQLPADIESKWLSQYHLRLNQGQQYQTFVVPKRKPAFLAEAPKPGEFSGVPLETVRSQLESLLGQTELIDQLRELRAQGVTGVADIILKLWNLKPSRSKEYREKRALVENLLKTL
jgi:hypothetical protein